MRLFPVMDELADLKQVYIDEVVGKIVDRVAFLNHTQMLVVFTDGTYLCATSRIGNGLPYLGTRVNAGTVEKEWK